MTTELIGKTALVTGATSGIGRATAIVLARHGATVFVHGRDQQRGDKVVAEIEAQSGHARFVSADLLQPDSVSALGAEVGDLDILVNNAGAMWFGESAKMTVPEFDLLFDSNVRSAFFLTSTVAPSMAARGSGSIINLGSLGAFIGLSAGAAYGATKASMQALTRAWAAEYSPHGVRVNAVAPGPVQPATGSDPIVDSIAATTLLRRPADAEEIGEVIAFLAGPRASYITGAVIPVDAGRSVA